MVLSLAVFNVADAVPSGELRILLQSLIVAKGAGEIWFAVNDAVAKPAATPEAQPDPAPVSGFVPLGFRAIPNLAEPRTFQSAVRNVKQHDPRWQQFGYAVCNGAGMAQTKWTGKGRPFSKPEFETQMQDWLRGQIVKPKSLKGNSAGFMPNGARGWQYFKDLGDGRAWIALPYRD